VDLDLLNTLLLVVVVPVVVIWAVEEAEVASSPEN
jgi:hypothetical protein